MFHNDRIVMLVNAWNIGTTGQIKFTSTAALNREQPKMFTSVIQLQVVENL